MRVVDIRPIGARSPRRFAGKSVMLWARSLAHALGRHTPSLNSACSIVRFIQNLVLFVDVQGRFIAKSPRSAFCAASQPRAAAMTPAEPLNGQLTRFAPVGIRSDSKPPLLRQRDLTSR